MGLPIPGNITCDVYHAPNAPPAAPDIPGLRVYLYGGNFSRRSEAGEGDPVDLRYTHVLLAELGSDIRDGVSNLTASANYDTVWVPDLTGTKFVVKFVERIGRGGSSDHLKIYLDRDLPTWPTEYV